MSLKKHIVIALAAILLLTGGAVASAQTSTTTDTIPGTPNTGMGGDATTNWLLLGATGVAVLAGIGYLARKPEIDSHNN